MRKSLLVAALTLTSCSLFRPSEQTQAMVEGAGTLAQLHAELYTALDQILAIIDQKNPGNTETPKIRAQLATNRANAEKVEADLTRLIKSQSFDPDTATRLIGLVQALLEKK